MSLTNHQGDDMTAYENDFILAQEELIENPDPRIPVSLALDVSSSMRGEPIAELQRGVETFFEAVCADEIARTSAETAIVTFGTYAETLLDFRSVESQEVPRLSASGTTSMGEGVLLALDLLEARKAEYREAGVDYYQPWLVLMTDGYPTDDITEAAERITKLVEARKLSVFPIAIGNADTSVLARLGGGRPPLKLQGLKFDAFFNWLSRSVSRVSQSTPGERVALPGGLEAWAQL
jgi:uncharacterized protein YegL